MSLLCLLESAMCTDMHTHTHMQTFDTWSRVVAIFIRCVWERNLRLPSWTLVSEPLLAGDGAAVVYVARLLAPVPDSARFGTQGVSSCCPSLSWSVHRLGLCLLSSIACVSLCLSLSLPRTHGVMRFGSQAAVLTAATCTCNT